MNPLRSVQRRALIAAALTTASVLLLILLYWQSVSAGSLPSPTQPLFAKPQPDAARTNSSSVKVLAATNVSKPEDPLAAVASKLPAPADLSRYAAPPPVGRRGADLAPNPARVKPTAAASMPLGISAKQEWGVTNLLADDERLIQRWLATTNLRPAIRVEYEPSDILRLSTELGRGLLVAGQGASARREIFLQSEPGGAPLFSPFTRSVAGKFSTYSLALQPSPALERVTAPLLAYFPESDFDLAFVPDNSLAGKIFARAAQAIRAHPQARAHPNAAVVEGKLFLQGSEPVFEVLHVE
jgi:hypothetical protein